MNRDLTDNRTKGILLMVAFAVFGPVIDTFAKLSAQAIPAGEVALARFAVQAAILLPLTILLGRAHRPDRREMMLHLARGGLILVATALFFRAIKDMAIADAISIFFIEPLLVVLAGGFFLGEPVGWRRIAACIVGFFSALLVIQPSFEEFGWVAILPVGTAILFTFYLLLTRTMTAKTDPLALQAYTAIGALVIIVPVTIAGEVFSLGPLDPVMPQGIFWFYMFGVGVAAAIAHLFISFAFKYAPASILAPLQYLEIVAATFFGYVVFGNLPNDLTYIGVSIIIGSGMYVFWRERQISKAPRPPNQEIAPGP